MLLRSAPPCPSANLVVRDEENVSKMFDANRPFMRDIAAGTDWPPTHDAPTKATPQQAVVKEHRNQEKIDELLSGEETVLLKVLEDIRMEQSSLRKLFQKHFDDMHAEVNNVNDTLTAVKAQLKTLAQAQSAEGGFVEESVEDLAEDSVAITQNPKDDIQGKVSVKALLQGNQPQEKKSLTQQILETRGFEVFITSVILLNAFTMSAGVQMQGLHTGTKLGFRDDGSDESDWNLHILRLLIIEYCFNVIYFVELVARLWAYRLNFFYSTSNILDLGIVLISCVDSFVVKQLNTSIDLSTLRLIRLTRMFRLVKLAQHTKRTKTLRLLIHTLFVAIHGVVWSVLLLAATILASGILIAQTAQGYLEGNALDFETKRWLYSWFGTTLSSMYTLLECTFTGRWGIYARRLIEDVHYSFGIFWVLWVVLVNFTMMRVIGALFLKQTMEGAAVEAERQAMRQVKDKKISRDALRAMFDEIVSVGEGDDGMAIPEEVTAMIEDPKNTYILTKLQVDIDEVRSFIELCASDDGMVDRKEFVQGILFMATSSPMLDRMKSMRFQVKIAKAVDKGFTRLIQDIEGLHGEKSIKSKSHSKCGVT